MSLILNIETATEICSVCVSKDGKVVALTESEQPLAHASKLTLLIAETLKKEGIRLEDLDAVAVSEGPGSYTGLRIGAATAKGICYSLDKPMLAVDTLKSIALAAMEKMQTGGYYIPMIDARRMEVYTAVYEYEKKNPLEKTKAKIIESDSFKEYLEKGKPVFLCGNGAEKCLKLLSSPHIQLVNIGCSAAYLAPLSQNLFISASYSDLAYFTPSYLKSPKITISKKKL